MLFAELSDAYGTSFGSIGKKKKKVEPIANKIDNENELSNNIKVEEYNKEFTHCEPLQPPHYKLPISEKVMQNYNKAYHNFLKERNVNQLNHKNVKDTINVSPSPNKKNKHNINIYENYNKIKLEDIKEIEPYYDEDLDSYLNINDFNSIDYNISDICEDDVKRELMRKNYNLKTQEPLNFNTDDYILIPKNKLKNSKNNHKKIYTPIPQNLNTYNNTDIDTDTDTDTDTDIDSEDEKTNNIYRNDNQKHKAIIEPFKNKNKRTKEKFINKDYQNPPYVLQGYSQENVSKKDPINNFYKNIINIGLFILIGIFIIFLLDLLTELALHKGMKQTVEILIPLLEELKNLKEK